MGRVLSDACKGERMIGSGYALYRKRPANRCIGTQQNQCVAQAVQAMPKTVDTGILYAQTISHQAAGAPSWAKHSA